MNAKVFLFDPKIILLRDSYKKRQNFMQNSTLRVLNLCTFTKYIISTKYIYIYYINYIYYVDKPIYIFYLDQQDANQQVILNIQSFAPSGSKQDKGKFLNYTKT